MQIFFCFFSFVLYSFLFLCFLNLSLFYTPKWRNHFWHIHPLFVAFLHRVRFLLIGKYPFPQYWLFKNGFPCRRLTDRSTGKIGFLIFFFFSFFCALSSILALCIRFFLGIIFPSYASFCKPYRLISTHQRLPDM